MDGRVEILSSAFAAGWARLPGAGAAYVGAWLGAEMIGVAEAGGTRPDLVAAGDAGGFCARSFLILFNRDVAAGLVGAVVVRNILTQEVIPAADKVRIDAGPGLQVFILGSPRSGTSELAATLATQLGLPWLGEGHAGPLLAGAADFFAGDAASGNDMVRFLADQGLRKVAVEATRGVYFASHGSVSFLDKTPGVPMIGAAPFLLECFPRAKFIFLRRNGVSNVLSRMAKFGGDFQEHCADWAAAMIRWLEVSVELPHFLEVNQEDMLDSPEEVAAEVAGYLGVPAGGIAESLRTGALEHTGAGLHRTRLAETGWSADQKAVFARDCGAAMALFGYTETGVGAEALA